MVKSSRVSQPDSNAAAGAEVPTPPQLTPADRTLAFVIGAMVLGLLLREVVRGVLPGDPGEFQFAAWRWGLAHPTGYPLYLLLGGAWQHLWALAGVAPATALNALSAVFTAAAVGLCYLLLRRWLPGPLLATRLAAGLGAAMLAANPTLRTQSLQAEVYSLHLLLVVAILLAATHLASHAAGRWALPTLALLVGLAFTHHAMTVLLLPPLVAYLWLARPAWWRVGRSWLWAAPALALPLLLYLYIPLRSGPDASPWLHQPLGNGVLTLYDGSWQAFLAYLSGRSISVGFLGPAEAAARVPAAMVLWLRHYEWPGLLLAALGLFVLVRTRNWPLLALTLGYALLQQVFNLFYAIGDIFVYYIPIYFMACVWISFGAAGIGAALRFGPPDAAGDERRRTQLLQRWGAAFVVVLYLLPLQFWARYAPLVQQLQAASDQAVATWNAILAADPPAHAVLVTNDRDELPPLFYLQTVEGRGVGHTGLFPLLAPDARFADIGATLQTALDAGGAPVYLIKPMPGLEARFALRPANAPLVQVLGPAATAPPAHRVDATYGPLRLMGYDLRTAPEGLAVTLQWQVNGALPGNYTTTVQAFDAAGAKLGQDDHPAGGDYYPTSLWKVGETLADRHTLALPAGAKPARLLVGMYQGPDAKLLAPLLQVELGE